MPRGRRSRRGWVGEELLQRGHEVLRGQAVQVQQRQDLADLPDRHASGGSASRDSSTGFEHCSRDVGQRAAYCRLSIMTTACSSRTLAGHIHSSNRHLPVTAHAPIIVQRVVAVQQHDRARRGHRAHPRGALVTYVGWRWIFYVNVPITLAGIVLAIRVVPDLRQGRRRRLDVIGVPLTVAARPGPPPLPSSSCSAPRVALLLRRRESNRQVTFTPRSAPRVGS